MNTTSKTNGNKEVRISSFKVLGLFLLTCLMTTGCATPMRSIQFDQTFHQMKPFDQLEQTAQSKTAFEFKLDEKSLDRKISWRYQNRNTKTLLSHINYEQSVALFEETARMIDARHYSPKSYGDRTRQGLRNLKVAIENRSFLESNRINPNAESVALVKGQLEHVINTWTARNEADAMKALRWSVALLGRHLGVSPKAVVFEFTNGSIDSLDKYSSLNYDPKRSGPKVDAGDSIVGVGVEMKWSERGALVIRPLQNSPAEKAGLKKGDLILSVNGQDFAGKDLNAMADLISGPKGSIILMKIERNGNRPTLLTVKRGVIEMKSVSEVRMLGGESKVGYIRIDRFSKDTSDLLDKGLWSLYKEGMKSLIVDVRGNPGGLLTTAISVSDKFIPYGKIVSTKGRNHSDNTSEKANYSQTWRVPLVVLVDKNSASASEIFAAAIQDHGRGVIVGRKSYGKGTVQTYFQLHSVQANLKLTTAKFYSPKGREMAGQGVTPDVIVPLSKGDTALTSRDADVEKAIELASGGKLGEMVTRVMNREPTVNYQQLAS